MKAPDQFDACIATKVNERLRRVEKKTRKPASELGTASDAASPIPTTPTDAHVLNFDIQHDVTPSTFHGLRTYLEL